MTTNKLAAALRKIILQPDAFMDIDGWEEIPLSVNRHHTTTGSELLRVEFSSATFNITITKARTGN